MLEHSQAKPHRSQGRTANSEFYRMTNISRILSRPRKNLMEE
jgi:hypothetical protein